MSVIVIHDPFRELPDGSIFDTVLDSSALQRRGVCTLPWEADEQYSRVGWGNGRVPRPGHPPVCSMAVDLGRTDEFSWLNWAVVLYPIGTRPFGTLQIVTDVTRALGGTIGISAPVSPPRIEALPMHGNCLMARGQMRCGGRGVSAIAFAGVVQDVSIGITAVTFTRQQVAL